MPKYKIIFAGELQDEIYDSYEFAEEQALYSVSCSRLGAEILHMSNPGDYPLDDYEEPDYEIIEVDD